MTALGKWTLGHSCVNLVGAVLLNDLALLPVDATQHCFLFLAKIVLDVS